MLEPTLNAGIARTELLIRILTVIIKVGKYLPWIVLAFAVGNLTLAVLDFTYWNNVAGGVLNSVLALGGFYFFVQLSKRRKIHRYEYRYTGRHLRREKEDEERRYERQQGAAARSSHWARG